MSHPPMTVAGHRLDLECLFAGDLQTSHADLTLDTATPLPPDFAAAVDHMADLLTDLPAARRFTNGPALCFTAPPRLVGGRLTGTLAPVGYYAKALAAGTIPADILECLTRHWNPDIPAPRQWPARIASQTHLTRPNAGLSVGLLTPGPGDVPHLLLANRSHQVAVNPGVVTPSFSEGIEPSDVSDLAAAVRRGLDEEVGVGLPCEPNRTRIVATYLDHGNSRGYGILGLLEVNAGHETITALRDSAVDADESTAAFTCPVTVDGIANLLLDRPWGVVWQPTLLLALRALDLVAGPGAPDELGSRLRESGWGPGYQPVRDSRPAALR